MLAHRVVAGAERVVAAAGPHLVAPRQGVAVAMEQKKMPVGGMSRLVGQAGPDWGERPVSKVDGDFDSLAVQASQRRPDALPPPRGAGPPIDDRPVVAARKILDDPLSSKK